MVHILFCVLFFQKSCLCNGWGIVWDRLLGGFIPIGFAYWIGCVPTSRQQRRQGTLYTRISPHSPASTGNLCVFVCLIKINQDRSKQRPCTPAHHNQGCGSQRELEWEEKETPSERCETDWENIFPAYKHDDKIDRFSSPCTASMSGLECCFQRPPDGKMCTFAQPLSCIPSRQNSLQGVIQAHPARDEWHRTVHCTHTHKHTMAVWQIPLFTNYFSAMTYFDSSGGSADDGYGKFSEACPTIQRLWWDASDGSERKPQVCRIPCSHATLATYFFSIS